MTPAHANPLRQPRPARGQRILQQRVYYTNERGAVARQVGARLVLARHVLWLDAERSIPISAITSAEIVERRGLVRRRFLQLTYLNPITGGREVVHLATLDFLGFYRRKPLERLVAAVEQVRATAMDAPASATEPRADPALSRCEVCGARPATYVPYVFQVAALVFVYRSGTRRRLHCRRHNLVHGLFYWAVTVLAGWPAFVPSILVTYPQITNAAGKNLTPSLGKRASVLALVPPVVFLGLVVWGAVRVFS